MPRALGVFDLDEESCSIWLEVVPVAARRLGPRRATPGRRACSAGSRPARGAGAERWSESTTSTMRDYLEGRLALQVLPDAARRAASGSTRWWPAPSTTSCAARLLERGRPCRRHRRRARRRFPMVASHGDACPNNLLTPSGHDGFVLIDYGFWDPDPSASTSPSCWSVTSRSDGAAATTCRRSRTRSSPAYVAGLRAEGCDDPGGRRTPRPTRCSC